MNSFESAGRPVRAYIVFAEGITIENGIKAVEAEVLQGEDLDVSRIDKKGHAVVVRISGQHTDAIKKLPEVTRVKIEQPARPTGRRATLL